MVFSAYIIFLQVINLLKFLTKHLFCALFISVVGTSLILPNQATAQITDQDLFGNTAPKDGGWQTLADILKKIEPSVDTRLPLTPSQITDKIKALIDRGDYDQALEIISKRYIQRKQQNEIGDDVQLMFLEARANADAGNSSEAIKIYQDMTVHYPELPEPWNNLASEYTKQGHIKMAEQALQTAIAIDPNYNQAILNLGLVQLMLARDSFIQAAKSGSSQANNLAQQTYNILQNN